MACAARIRLCDGTVQAGIREVDMDDSGDESPDPEAEAAASLRAKSRHAADLHCPVVYCMFTSCNCSLEEVTACI